MKFSTSNPIHLLVLGILVVAAGAYLGDYLLERKEAKRLAAAGDM